jgi:hypothetical protein
MEKLERVQSMTYRRMSNIDSELERFEERPESDIHGRYGLLRRRFEELEKLYYKLRRSEAPDPRQLIARIFAEQAGSLRRQAYISAATSSTHFKSRQPMPQEYRGILSASRGKSGKGDKSDKLVML